MISSLNLFPSDSGLKKKKKKAKQLQVQQGKMKTEDNISGKHQRGGKNEILTHPESFVPQ